MGNPRCVCRICVVCTSSSLSCVIWIVGVFVHVRHRSVCSRGSLLGAVGCWRVGISRWIAWILLVRSRRTCLSQSLVLAPGEYGRCLPTVAEPNTVCTTVQCCTSRACHSYTMWYLFLRDISSHYGSSIAFFLKIIRCRQTQTCLGIQCAVCCFRHTWWSAAAGFKERESFVYGG